MCSAIFTQHPLEESGTDMILHGNYAYVYEIRAQGDYKFTRKLDIEENHDLIRAIREGLNHDKHSN